MRNVTAIVTSAFALAWAFRRIQPCAVANGPTKGFFEVSQRSSSIDPPWAVVARRHAFTQADVRGQPPD
jgi:hypothetical protein